MHMHDILNAEIDAFRKTHRGPGRFDMQILETGTIRQDTEEHRLGDGWSTQALAAHAAAFGGHVTSVDLDTRVAETVLTRLGLVDQVTLRQGYSVEWMAAMIAAGQRFDVVLLDSENDPQLILHEYMLALKLMEARPCLLLVDDVVPGSATVRKGELLLPWLEQRGETYRVLPRTGGGVRSGVLSMVVR
jgi:methyltransferase family protein